jgi:hypothetical protein
MFCYVTARLPWAFATRDDSGCRSVMSGRRRERVNSTFNLHQAENARLAFDRMISESTVSRWLAGHFA